MRSALTRMILLLVPVLLAATASAQAGRKEKKEKLLVDSRAQAEGWYLPVHGEVTVAGSKTVEGVTVKVFRENKDLGTFPVNKRGVFDLELDLDFAFTLLIQKPGFQNKLIYVETHLPKDLVQYPAYACFVNMEPESATSASDPFYLDFPSAIVRYDAEMGGYYHSEVYLQHINNKLRSVAQASF